MVRRVKKSPPSQPTNKNNGENSVELNHFALENLCFSGYIFMLFLYDIDVISSHVFLYSLLYLNLREITFSSDHFTYNTAILLFISFSFVRIQSLRRFM